MRKPTFILFVLLIAARPLLAQEPVIGSQPKSPKAPTDPNKLWVRLNLVHVPVTVTNDKNQRVTDLTYEDFRVYEDNKLQHIAYFTPKALGGELLRIGVIFDTSNIRNQLRVEQEAAVDFLNTTVRPSKDMGFVVALGEVPQLVQDYTPDTKKLSEAIWSLRAGGAPILYDAIYYACKEKLLFFPPPEPYLPHPLIIISDDEDNYSEHSAEEAITMAQRAEVAIYAISASRAGSPGQGRKVLQRLSEETGGQAFFPSQANKMAATFKEISEDLNSQYDLVYVSTNRALDGTFRTITIEPLKRGLRVRAKPGYFAPSK